MKCLNCKKETDNPKYCSRSCAAKVNNKTPKRKRKTKCRDCSKLVISGYTYCEDCISLGRHQRNSMWLADRTFGEEIKGKSGAGKYTNIRIHARKVVKNEKKECVKCGYDKHVEVCHIKPIKDFSFDSLISEINDMKNLMLLCPNCHWEFDNIRNTN